MHAGSSPHALMVMIVEYLPYFAADSTCDITIDPTNQNQYIVWGSWWTRRDCFPTFH